MDDEGGETKDTENSSQVEFRLENQISDSDDEEEDFESILTFPAISPVSTSSGKHKYDNKLFIHKNFILLFFNKQVSSHVDLLLHQSPQPLFRQIVRFIAQ